MEVSFDEKILVALYYATVENGIGGYRISQIVPVGSTLLEAREAAKRLECQGYISMPQSMSAGPIIYITKEGCSKAQSLLK